MNLFRQTLTAAATNSALIEGDRIYFRPALQFVPVAWVEQMAAYEWECDETGACSHPTAKRAGCYFGEESEGCWICDALLKDSNVLAMTPAQIMRNLLPHA